jgi:hypothetical protein
MCSPKENAAMKSPGSALKWFFIMMFVVLTPILLLLCTPIQAQRYLYNVTELGVGNSPANITSVDFNHDGRPDFAVTNFSDNTVSVILGKGDGQFSTKVNYVTGASPSAMVAADFRRDGKIDLAIANENAGTVSILLGKLNGSFQTRVDYPVGSDPIGDVAADFNGDGKPDLAVANQNDSTVSVLFGNGDGTFQSQIVIAVGTLPTSFASGDFNGDHKVDLITSCPGAGVVSVLLNNGDGSFTRVDSSSGVFSPDISRLAVGDFNQDGNLDVVVSSNTLQKLFLLAGDGNGSFQSPSAISNSAIGGVYALFAADVNHDGKPDLVANIGGPSGIEVLLGKGDGTFLQPVISPSESPISVAITDLNGDGRPDLAVTNPIINSVDLYIGKGDGSFAKPKSVGLSQTVYGPNSTVAADFNGDGKVDLAVAETNFPHGKISVVLGNGKGTFGTPHNSSLVSAAINNQDEMLMGDFNGDGKPDLVIMDDYSTGFQVLLGNGDGTFQPPIDTQLNTSLNFAVGDFNSDGKTDVVVTTSANGQTLVSIYLSNGDGTFRLGVQFAESFGGITVADVNNDRKLDLVFTSFGQPLLVMLGNGDGTFQKPIFGPSAIYSGPAVIRDFNGDAKPDIAVGTYNGIALLQGNGDGTFQSPVYSNSTIQFCCQMVAADVNHDGKPDLINVVNSYVSVYVMLGNGDGTFQPARTYNANGQVFSGNMVTGDFNSDGVADIGLTIQNVFTGKTMVSTYLSTPTISSFPSSLNFGTLNVGTTSLAMQIQVANHGNAKLLISSIGITGDFLEQNNCGTGLAIGHSCAVQVYFKPTAKGVRSGALIIKENAVAGTQRIPLKGIGN